MQSGHTDLSDLEAVRQRSFALDIPSAELLDSILEFANNVYGQDDILASLPLVGAFAAPQSFSPTWATPKLS